MAHDHPHDHGHDPGPDHRHDPGRDAPARRILIALVLTASFIGVELFAGLVARSLALLSDAGHMFADAGSLALALVAQRVAARPHTHGHTYGFRRAETLAAFANGVALGVSAVWIIVEAVERWHAPPDVRGGWMFAVATAGLAVNLAAAWVLSHGGHNTNTRAALAHVLADAAGSVAAMVAAALVIFLGWKRADPAISVLLSVMILWGSWKLIREAVDVLMEATPSRLDVGALAHTIRGAAGVADLHDLHAWSISEGFDVVTVHVVLDGTRHGTDVARDVGALVMRVHRVRHVTVQPEAPPAQAALRPPETLVRRG